MIQRRRPLTRAVSLTVALTLIIALALSGCSSPSKPESQNRTAPNVSGRTPLVAPGEKDEYYGFFSAGPFGGVWVVGIPSMRILREIPVFEARAGYGWGYDPASRAMMQNSMADPSVPSWGDTHHPLLSKTGGEYDGKWLFINDLANSRIAKVDLTTFTTAAITRVPNIQGVHGIAVHPDTKYVFSTGEFEIPRDLKDTNNPANYSTAITALDPVSMTPVWQVPILQGGTDIMGATHDGRYVFATSYNTEQAVDLKGMIKAEKDAAVFVDIGKADEAVKAGKVTERNGVKVIDPNTEGLLTFVPVPKNPHGIDPTPDGKYIVASGKLSPTATVIDAQTLKVVAEPELGAGPLHSAFDGRGNGYTTMFLDSTVVKWNIDDAVAGKPKEQYIKDVIDVHYSPGHLMADGSDSRSPDGKYLISLNKFSKDRFLPVGPDLPENVQLIDISGDKMNMLLEMPIMPEPHDALIARASIFKPIAVNDADASAAHVGIKPVKEGESRVERDGNKVTVYMTAKRSEYGLSEIKVKKGDHVTMYVTSVETIADVTHGFAIPDYGINKALTPGETIKVEFVADKAGVYWFYCTWFCSALHLEMRARLIVEE